MSQPSQQSPSPPVLTDLASLITHHTSIITNFLTNRNLPHPQFSTSIPSFPPPDCPPKIHMSRMSIAQLCRDLAELVLGPIDALIHPLVSMKVDIGVLRTINYYNIPEAVPINGCIGYEELSKRTGLNADILKRIIRYASTTGIFTEVQYNPTSNSHTRNKDSVQSIKEGVGVAHTPTSLALLTSPRLRGVLRHNLDDIFPAFLSLPESLQQNQNSQEPNESPFNFAYKTEQTWFDWMSKPGRETSLQSYHQTLGFLSEGAFNAGLAASAPVFKRLGPGSTIVDIGGSTGHVSIALAQQLPHPNFIVQDLPSTIESVKSEEIPQEVRDRIQFQPHNFFTPQTEAADVFLLRFVLHDWSDKYCVKILSSLLPQLKANPAARIALLEVVLPEPGTVPTFVERGARSADIQMLGYANARERDRGHWDRLVKETDEGLVVWDVYEPVGCAFGVVEVGLRGGRTGIEQGSLE
ncbi:S-adenosyl-L-methionine-dependent methyltransferase [Lindgomyces ingoldianus]|uniref:S-adenosyl-L-methionine-dependent methyltransferase n=1 Tax=Lindgomyces ingoldianus TaxID=673940 RepID=A0ACB6RBU8_9PLEO|nr:S-adenosyl-L-methionine-dependent methyltransferase [Lindgomyces ingoldianus]KAF2475992.1 S-adenosyl-L-methionine-dependent methyltransferase [Lindgomyces ingoldianus]